MRILFGFFLLPLLLFALNANGQIIPFEKDSLHIITPGRNSVPAPYKTTLLPPRRYVFKGVREIIPGKSRTETTGILRSTKAPEIFEFKNTSDPQKNNQPSVEPKTIKVQFLPTEVYDKRTNNQGYAETITAQKPVQKTAGPFRYKENTIINAQFVDVAQGLFSSYINTIAEDKFGVVWMGSSNAGLLAFNSNTFIQYTVEHGLKSESINKILYASSGKLWLGTSKYGAVCFDGRKFTYINEETGLPGNKVMSLLEDKNGNIWIGTTNGLAKYNDKELTLFTKEQGLNCRQVYDLCEDNKGNIWIATFNSGIFKFDRKTFTNYSTSNGLPTNAVWSIKADNDGDIWMGTFGEGIIRFNGKVIKQYSTPQGINTTEVLNINKDKKGNLWFGSDGNGLLKYDGRAFTHIIQNQGLTSNRITEIIQSAAGIYWIATLGGGLMRYDGGEFRYITEKEGIAGDIALSFYAQKESDLWIGMWNQGLVKFDGKHFNSYSINTGLPGNTIWSITHGNDKNLWFATEGAGIFSLNKGQITSFTNDHGLIHNETYILHKDDKKLWIGTYAGLSSFDGKSFANYGEKQGLLLDNIKGLVNDKNGNLWIASSSKGIAVFTGSEFYHFKQQHGLSSNIAYGFYEDDDQNLWIATNNKINILPKEILDSIETDANKKEKTNHKNLYNLFQSKVKFVSTYDGLISNSIKNITADLKGNIWVGTKNGISRFTKTKKVKDSSRFVEICGTKFSIHNFGYNQGFIGGNVFSSNSVGIDTDSSMWWGSGKMLINFKPQLNQQQTVSPVAIVTNVDLFYENIDWQTEGKQNSVEKKLKKKHHIKTNIAVNYTGTTPWQQLPKNLTLSHRVNHLTFSFTGIDWQHPENVRYTFILEGYEDEWNPATLLHKSTYSNLNPGKYTFRVKAIAADGQQSPESSFSFEILPPWWSTLWFRISAALLVILIIYLIYQWRIRTFKQRQKELEKIVKERTAEISEKNEELLQQKEEILTQRNEIEIKKNQMELIHKDLMNSIEYARFIQRNIFTSQELLSKNFKEHMLMFYPRDNVSGDFYWWAKMGSRIVITIADCTGHGVPGALMSMLGISFLREIVVKEHLLEPGKILNKLRTEVINALSQKMELGKQKDGMDLALISIDLEKKQLQYAGARNPLIIIRNNEIIEFKADKAPISVYVKMRPFTTHDIELQENDQIYLFTDGYPDQFGGQKGQKFKRKPFKELLQSLANMPMQEQLAELKDHFHNWKKNYEQIDDITVLGLKI